MSVFKTAKSSAVYWYSFDIQRQRFSGSTQCTQRKEAVKFEDAEKEKARAAIKAQAKVKSSLQIVDVAARYWEMVGRHHAGAETTERDLNRLVDYFGETKLLTDIHDSDVSALVAWRRGHHVKSNKKPLPPNGGKGLAKKTSAPNGANVSKLVAPATVNRSTVEPLKKLFTFCKTKERVRFDDEPEWKSHFLPEPEERVRELHEHEAKAIDDNMRDDYKPIFDFVAASGWRRGSAVTLVWSEVNWSTSTITKLGKGGRRITLRITPSIAAILEPLKGHHPEAVFCYVAEKTIKANGALAPHIVRGQRYPITAEGLKTRWRRTRDDAGLEDFRFHDFRHDTATKLLRATGNLKLVQRALGHRNISTTLKYAHVLDDEVSAALEALSASRSKPAPAPDSNTTSTSHSNGSSTTHSNCAAAHNLESDDAAPIAKAG
jgi:integrase